MIHTPLTATDWTANSAARRILASFERHPPLSAPIPHHQRWDRHDTQFVGYRVECLTRLRTKMTNAAFLVAEAAGDREAAHAIADQPGVQDAVAEALRIPVLSPIMVRPVDLDPAAWDYAALNGETA